MTEELVLLIAEIMCWVGVIASAPFLYEVFSQFARYLQLTYKTNSQISLIDEKGNELILTLKHGTEAKDIAEILRKSLNDAKQSSL